MADKMASPKLDYIDALRGFAILGVIGCHLFYFGNDNVHLTIHSLIENGARGVQLFFVLSAFTLFLSFNKTTALDAHSVRNFFIRRYFRIAPMYYIGILYFQYHYKIVPAAWIHGDPQGITVKNILANVFFIHGFHPYWLSGLVFGGWSIGVEMIFYCLVPALCRLINNLNAAFVFLLIAILFRALLELVFTHYCPIADLAAWRDFVQLYLPGQLPVFACGIIMYYLVYTPKSEWYIAPIVIYILIGLIIFQLMSAGWVFIDEFCLYGIVFAGLGTVLAKRKVILLVNPVTTYIGKISYSLYIVHYALYYWMSRLGYKDIMSVTSKYTNLVNLALRFICIVFIATVVATIFYHLIERPFQSIGKRIIRRAPVKAEENAI